MDSKRAFAIRCSCVRQIKQHASRLSRNNALPKFKVHTIFPLRYELIYPPSALSPEDQSLVDTMFEDHNMDVDNTVLPSHTETDDESICEEGDEFSDLTNEFTGW